MSLARAVKRAGFRAFGLLARPFVRRTRDVSALSPKKILVIQLQQVGDSVVFTPTLRALRARFPDAELAMLVNSVSYQLYRKSPHVDRFFVADSWRTGPGGTRLRPMLPVLRKIRREGYDVAITCVTQQAFKYGLIAWLSGAKVRVGFDEGGRGVLYTLPLPVRLDDNMPSNNLDIARAFGASIESTHEEVSFDSADDAHVIALLAELGVSGDAPLVVMHPGTNWESKAWFPDRWATVADHVVRNWGAQVLFLGIPREQPTVDAIRALMREPSHEVVGRTDLTQLAALLNRARLFIGTDSGPRNMAGAAGIPHIVLMCAQDDTMRWLGFRERERFLRELPPCHGCLLAVSAHDRLCMRMIETAAVIALCDAELGPSKRSQVLSTNVA